MSCTPLAVTLGLLSINAAQLPPVGVALPGKCIFFRGSSRMQGCSPLSRTLSLLVIVEGDQRSEGSRGEPRTPRARDPRGCINNLQQEGDIRAHAHIPSVMLPDAEQGYQSAGACRREPLGGVSPLSYLNSIRGGQLGCNGQWAAEETAIPAASIKTDHPTSNST